MQAPADPRVRSFFADASNAHRAAAPSPVLRTFALDGAHIRLRLAGPALLPHVWAALAHLEVAPDRSPSLTILCFDTMSTGVSLPAFPWPSEYSRACNGASTEPGANPVVLFRDADINGVLQTRTQLLWMLDSASNTGLFWLPSPDEAPKEACSAPLRPILHWWFRTRGIQMAHAAAVGTPTGGVLLTGKSGSGKSTVALACIEAGLQFAGDDYVMLRPGSDPMAFSAYNSAKLRAEEAEVFPGLDGTSVANRASETGKEVLMLHPRFSRSITTGLPLKGVLSLRVSGRSRFEEISPVECLRALAPSTMFQLWGSDQGDLKRLSGIVMQLPCFVLELGPDLREAPRVVKGFLSGERR